MKKTHYIFWVTSFLLVFGLSVATASASHSWGGYHWARTANPFTLKLGNDLSSNWVPFLNTASATWSLSPILDTTIVSGQTNGRTCRATLGRVEVCNYKYGNNGWLGIASIWINGLHIVQGTVKLNDTYFNTSTYNKPAWRNLVVCQEVAHTFGLDHQDENFTNPNLGTCMDYTNDPDGSIYHQLDNQYPNAHDYEELGIIYAHLDSTNTASQSVAGKLNSASDTGDVGENKSDWGRAIRKDNKGRDSVFEKDLGSGRKAITNVFWAE